MLAPQRRAPTRRRTRAPRLRAGPHGVHAAAHPEARVPSKAASSPGRPVPHNALKSPCHVPPRRSRCTRAPSGPPVCPRPPPLGARRLRPPSYYGGIFVVIRSSQTSTPYLRPSTPSPSRVRHYDTPRFSLASLTQLGESAKSNRLTLVKPWSTWVITSKTEPTTPIDPLTKSTHTCGQPSVKNTVKPH
jgi:hypothetical protein